MERMAVEEDGIAGNCLTLTNWLPRAVLIIR